MNTPKKYMCQVNFNVDGTLLYDSEEELMRLQHRIEYSLLGVFFPRRGMPASAGAAGRGSGYGRATRGRAG